MTDAEHLTAIFDRLGKIDRDLATHSAHMRGELARMGDRLENLDERVRIQNSRVTKAEHRIHELETQTRIANHHAEEVEERRDFWRDKTVGLTFSFLLLVAGALLGYFL